MNTSRHTREPHPPVTTSHDLRHRLAAHTPRDPSVADHLLNLTAPSTGGDTVPVPDEAPVPIRAWTVAGIDTRHGHHRPDALTPRIAALVVGAYTRPGDTIMSVGYDPALAGAAGSGGRAYRSIARTADPANLEHPAGRIALIVLPWPPTTTPDSTHSTSLLQIFDACRRLMSPDGCTIVALAGQPTAHTFEEHRGILLPAAQQTGLDWLQHVVAITAPVPGHRGTWRAAPADRAALRAAGHLTIHLDLAVFAAARLPANSPNLSDVRRARAGSSSPPRRRGSATSQ